MKQILDEVNKLPNWSKVVISILLLLTAYLLFFIKDVRVNELKSQETIEKLKIENAVINSHLLFLNSEISSKQQEIDYLYDSYEKSKNVEQTINKKYETKKTNVRNLPIDSTISDLADWLK